MHPIKQGYLTMKLIQSVAIASLKNLQHNFPKMRGGSKAVWIFFRKFIQFGCAILPLDDHVLLYIVVGMWGVHCGRGNQVNRA